MLISINYIDDDIDSYPDIFENAATKTAPGSEQRVIAALKALRELSGLEAALDTEELIRYFAVNSYLMNFDSYSGPMLHNYYLYDDQGKLGLLPWDYNSAFGSFPMAGIVGHDNDSVMVVNQGIDTPLAGTDCSARPMWRWIIADEEYHARYRAAMATLIEEQFESGAFTRMVDRVYALIQPYIAQDPTAFYTAQEAQTAYKALRQLSLLRAESIRRQLDGTLAADTSLQVPADRVDASLLDLSELGSGETWKKHQG